jgi:hypothetical protein
MSDRRAVSAGHRAPEFLGASVAAANETWRVAVGGNRVESMTVDQIAHAFHSGHLNVRTPLWPPGTTGWQALGNFEQFQQYQQPAAYAGGGLSQFEEADDDPTRMWTGGGEMDLAGMEAAMGVGQSTEPDPRPNARTGIRQVVPSRGPVDASRPVPMAPPPQQMMSVPARPAPTASLPPSRSPSVVPASIPPFRKGRGNGLMLVAGLVGLVGLGSAVLAARGSWGNASEPAAVEPTVAAEATPAAEAPAPVLADPAPTAPPLDKAEAPKPAPSTEQGEAQLAKYEDTSAFVAGEPKPATAPEAAASTKAAKEAGESSRTASAKGQDDEDTGRAPAHSEKSAKASSKLKSEDAPAKRASVRETPKRASAAVASTKAKAPPAPEARVEKAEKAEKPAKSEKVEKAEAVEAPQAPASGAVNEAAAVALANSATLASSCRPPGGPSGQGKARVIYSNDGEVQSVEILTAKFRDTLTGSCVRMVFRRAKITPFKGEPPTFIKSFTIPES